MLGSAPTIPPYTDSSDSPGDLVEFFTNLPFLKTCSSLPPHFLLLLKQKAKCLSRILRPLTQQPNRYNYHHNHQLSSNTYSQLQTAEHIVDQSRINKSKQEVNHKAGRPPATTKSTENNQLPSQLHPAIRTLQQQISTIATTNGASCQASNFATLSANLPTSQSIILH